MGRRKKIRPEKTCPRCGKTHNLPGTFCSRSCANVRQHSEQDKQNKSESVARYFRTQDTEEHRWKLSHIMNAARMSITDSTVEMPSEEDMGIPLPPSQYDEEIGSRVGNDIWFDVE